MTTSMSSDPGVNLALLPEARFAETDVAAVEASVLAAYEGLTGTTLQPGDPVRLFLESLAYVVGVQNAVIEQAGRQGLLAYATGAHLDHLGALMGVSRLPAQPARLSLRFSLSEALSFAVPVPAGTRAATRDGSLAFATLADAEIAPGALHVDVAARCTSAGAAGSGLAAGQVDRLVDPLPHVAAVASITASVEGTDTEADDRLRERIRLAPESFTVAGSAGAYEARVLAVDAAIVAVAVTTPEPGMVDIRFVLEGGELPDEPMCDMVREALSDETVRPLTDKVLVGAPEVVEYAVSGRWYLCRADAVLLAGVTERVTRAVEDWRLWQRARPGRDINPTRLIAAVQAAGAKRVELDAPVFTTVSPTQIARETAIVLSFAGLEDE